MALKRRTTLRGRAYWPHIRALFFALIDRRMPWTARLIAVAVVFYAVWPFDLIPDFIPLVGWLDDLIIVPLGLWFAYRLIPDHIIADARKR
jgi:uncharacterized membrane protein YkvA (DUF1232 family)